MDIPRPGSHLDHLLQQSRVQLLQLSAMADLKANMLLTMSSVVITLAAPHVAKPHLRWPLVVLIVFCLLTILLASYAAMPKAVPFLAKSVPPADFHCPTFNLLFFGDYSRMSYDQFITAMDQVMNDHNLVYESMVREIYLAGTYLGTKKFRYVQLAYIAFMTGLVTSGIAILLSTDVV